MKKVGVTDVHSGRITSIMFELMKEEPQTTKVGAYKFNVLTAYIYSFQNPRQQMEILHLSGVLITNVMTVSYPILFVEE